MNPVDHPHGGGEGATPLGNHPHAVGRADDRLPTRKKRKGSDRYIVRGRRRGKKGGTLMSRSSKKGPLVEERLMRRIEEMNKADTKTRQHLVADVDDLPRDGRATPSPSTTAAGTCPCSCRSRWSATSSASSRPRALYRGHAGSGKVR